MKKFKFIYAFALAGILFSCSDDDNNSVADTVKPTFVITEPTNGETFDAGDEIHVDIDFSDNVELSSYKIDIHFAGDGHTHERNMNISEHIEWDYEATGNLSGKNDNLHLHIDIHHDAEDGEYHFGVFAIDKAGNQAVQWIEIDIHNHD